MELCQSFPRLDPFGGISISFVVKSASQPNIIFPAETKIICLTLELPWSQVTCDLREIEESKRQLFSSEISNERKKRKRDRKKLLNRTCRLLDADSLHEAPVDLGAGVLEVHVGLLGRHPLHPVLPGEGHRVLDLK